MMCNTRELELLYETYVPRPSKVHVTVSILLGYRMSTGWTGTPANSKTTLLALNIHHEFTWEWERIKLPAANAPILNCSKQLRFPVVPSGKIKICTKRRTCLIHLFTYHLICSAHGTACYLAYLRPITFWTLLNPLSTISNHLYSTWTRFFIQSCYKDSLSHFHKSYRFIKFKLFRSLEMTKLKLNEIKHAYVRPLNHSFMVSALATALAHCLIVVNSTSGSKNAECGATTRIGASVAFACSPRTVIHWNPAANAKPRIKTWATNHLMAL